MLAAAQGNPHASGYPVGAPVGSVVAAYGSGDALDYYAVLNDGLQPISGVLAAILRNTDSHGLTQPPRLSADEVWTVAEVEGRIVHYFWISTARR